MSKLYNYGLDIWGEDNFIIEEGKIKLNYLSKPALIDIVKEIRRKGIKGPILLRFPHLIEKQINSVYSHFKRASKENNYKGSFNAVFPLKVNQFPNFVKSLLQKGKKYGYGLEAGSKAELFIAMAFNNKNAPITVNGFKDEEMIILGFIAARMGYNITLTIEGLNELESIIQTAKKTPKNTTLPKIGLRIRLHSSGIGIWAKSGGINSKFGLTSTELVAAIERLRKENLLDNFTMIHFHIGSQITEITPMKKALREAGNIYADLKKMGAKNLHAINIGGGLAVEYSQHEEYHQKNYSIREFANDIVFMLQMISQSKKVQEPDIFIESGRYIAASHAVLTAPVLELFSQEYHENSLKLKENNPPLITELFELYKTINKNTALEYLHDSIDHMESLLTLFDLGYIDLIDRSNTEILIHLIIKKAMHLLKDKPHKELISIQERIQERYLINFSIFQSLPDYWGLGQNFPVMPLSKLDEIPVRSASLWDITCDSDGEIEFNIKKPLFLHDVDIKKEEYFLGFFLVGAYQEILGMKHNLFTHPTEATIEIDEKGYKIKNILESQSIYDILEDLDYDMKEVERKIKNNLDNIENLSEKDRDIILGQIYLFLNDNTYLKTVQK